MRRGCSSNFIKKRVTDGCVGDSFYYVEGRAQCSAELMRVETTAITTARAAMPEPRPM